MCSSLSRLYNLIIDMDGIIYHGDRLLPGAQKFFAWMRHRRIKFKLVTNNSSKTSSQYVEKLSELGIEVTADHILTSAEATALFLQRVSRRGARVYIIGETGLSESMRRRGFVLDESSPDYVVVGIDRAFSYEKMKKACLAIRRGARFVATNPDLLSPSEEGMVPGCGAILAAIEACTGVAPLIIGKPQEEMFKSAMEQMEAVKEETAILGDYLDTDIEGGRRAGIVAILILSGVSHREDLTDTRFQPDYIFDDLEQFMRAVEAATQDWR